VIATIGGVDVWTDSAGVFALPMERSVIEVAHDLGVVAVANARAIEIWDLRTRQRRELALGHEREIDQLAWSSTGILAAADDETVRLWDRASGRTRVIYAQAIAMVWSADGTSLFTTDGRVIQSWDVDVAKGASPIEVRQRLDALTSARIINGRLVTP
jgi:WD40 repeat protein